MWNVWIFEDEDGKVERCFSNKKKALQYAEKERNAISIENLGDNIFSITTEESTNPCYVSRYMVQ